MEMANIIYKQVPRVNTDITICPFCGSDIGACPTEKKAYAYRRNYEFKTICYLKLFCCCNCNIAYYVEGNSCVTNQLHHKYKVCLFDVESMDKESVRKVISSYPEHHSESDYDSEYDLEMYNDRFRKLTSDTIKEFKAPPETIGIFVYEKPDHRLKNLRAAFVVRGEDILSDGKIVAYGIAHEYAKILQKVYMNKLDEFTNQGQIRKLHYCYVSEELKQHIIAVDKVRIIEESSFAHPVNIYVYKGKGAYCRKNHHLEMVTAKIISARSIVKQSLSVYYCCVCDEYFVNDRTLFSFCRANGLPPFILYYLKNSYGGYDKSRYDTFNEYSELRLYGYYVSGDMENQSEYRKRLLEDIVDSGLMEKTDVLQYLEYLMMTRSHQPGAIARWRSDYDHLLNYRVDRHRIVWGRLTTK